ncbi:MAG TPA: general secretion pathway protein GspB [Steroidobacteraceae bacterium]
MSFILDALKKSETDRQRQNGPALFEVRVAPTRDKLPLWAVGLGVLLAVNLVIVAWVLLRRPSAAEAPAPPAAAAIQPPQQSYGSQGMAPAPSMSAQQGAAYPPPANAVPVNGAPPTAPVGQTAGMTQQPALGPGTVQGGVQSMPQTPAQANNGVQSATTDAGDKLNPDDVAPAADPGPPQPFGNHVIRSTANGVPLYNDVATTTRLPTLRLDLHVYAANPPERFVMINMHKLHEGDALPTEGVRVESITPFGAVLSHDGTKFLLPRD